MSGNVRTDQPGKTRESGRGLRRRWTAELGAWLRQQREARGWPKAEMARRLVQAGREAGDKSMPSASGMLHNIHRWEREGGISERHKLHYCRALGIHPSQFGLSTGEPARAPPSAGPLRRAGPAALVPVQRPAAASRNGRPVPASIGRASPTVEGKSPFWGVSRLSRGADGGARGKRPRRGVRAARHRRGHVGAASRGPGPAVRLSDTGTPLPAFLDMRRVRDRIYRLLDRRAAAARAD